MFHDSMVALMVMLLLCFLGMLVMFLFVLRSHSVMTTSMKEGQRQQQLAFSDIERQIMDLSFQLRESRGSSTAAPEDLSALLENIGNSSLMPSRGNEPSPLAGFAQATPASHSSGYAPAAYAAREAARVVAGSEDSLTLPSLGAPASGKATPVNRLAMGR